MSVRKIAREAGMSVGSLRHYFANRSELVAFSMRMVVERITARGEALEESGDPRRGVEEIIHQLLPLDAERRVESEVWLAFIGRALMDPTLRALNDEGYDALHDLLRQLIDALIREDLAVPDLDAELETERLQALIDGLLIHGVTRPQRVPTEQIASVLSRHLDSLCRTP